MRSPSPSPVLDLIFPPEECIHEEGAENYARHGVAAGTPVRHMGYDAIAMEEMHAPQVVVYD